MNAIALVFNLLTFLSFRYVVSFRQSTSNGLSFNNRYQIGNRHSMTMGYDTIVKVSSSFEARCNLLADKGYSLNEYMKLPVEQYVCIKMPLDATLERIDGDMFNLTVPPVTFFNLEVSPMIFCKVSQTSDSVIIESKEVVLRGSPYVIRLNGCYKINIKTVFKWSDTPIKKSIFSSSSILVEVDPPAPFKYFGRNVLEATGTIAMSIALRQIENAFVQSLAKNYERWATDSKYRIIRAQGQCEVSSDHQKQQLGDGSQTSSSSKLLLLSASQQQEQQKAAMNNNQLPKIKSKTILYTSYGKVSLPLTSSSFFPTGLLDRYTDNSNPMPQSVREIDLADFTTDPKSVTLTESEFSEEVASIEGIDIDAPAVLTDDICLVPGEPVVRIEEAPANARRIFTGVDIAARVDDVWAVLTDYENLQNVIPSLVKNEVVYRTKQGGARLAQVGGAKVLPGVTFTAKTVLDVSIYLEDSPLPANMSADHLQDAATDKAVREFDKVLPLTRNIFPRPYAITSLPHRDITMQNVLGEGDFEHYQGIWRMQSLPNCSPDGSDACRLTYAVELRPKGFLPVKLVEGRIAMDLRQNLGAIRSYVESKVKVKAKATTIIIDRATATTTTVGMVLNTDDKTSNKETTKDKKKRQVFNILNLPPIEEYNYNDDANNNNNNGNDNNYSRVVDTNTDQSSSRPIISTSSLLSSSSLSSNAIVSYSEKQSSSNLNDVSIDDNLAIVLSAIRNSISETDDKYSEVNNSDDNIVLSAMTNDVSVPLLGTIAVVTDTPNSSLLLSTVDAGTDTNDVTNNNSNNNIDSAVVTTASKNRFSFRRFFRLTRFLGEPTTVTAITTSSAIDDNISSTTDSSVIDGNINNSNGDGKNKNSIELNSDNSSNNNISSKNSSNNKSIEKMNIDEMRRAFVELKRENLLLKQQLTKY